MTGKAVPVRRLPSARRVICGAYECKKSFIPGRRGQVYCKEACQKAESRRLKAMADAFFQPKQDFKAVLSIARAIKQKCDWYQQWTRHGAYREEWCREVGVSLARSGVRFVGSMLGVFAVEDQPGAIKAMLDEGAWRGAFAEHFTAQVVECSPTDKRLSDALLPPLRGANWRDKKLDTKYRAMLLKGVSRVVLFAVKFPEPEPAQVPARECGPSASEYEGRKSEPSEYVGEYDIKVIFPNGGYQTFKK
jgi:hypothetical protein